MDVVLGSENEFVITNARTDGPGHGTVYQLSEPSVIPLSYSGAPKAIKVRSVRKETVAIQPTLMAFTSVTTAHGPHPIQQQAVLFM